MIGRHIGGFRIDRLICDRGLGAVYEGVQEWPPLSVAIKVLRLDCTPEMARSYDRRWKLVQTLHHPRIAATLSAGVEPWAGRNVPFQAMEHVPDAIPLRRYVISRRLSVQQILSLFQEVCDTVAAGHRQGVFHGYLTPHKVLIDPSGSPKVVDYCNFLATSCSCDSIPPATKSKPSLVDIGYMSPEQYKLPASAIDARADVYSLGALLYELLTGLPPYDVGNRSISEAAELIRHTRPMSPRRCNERISSAVAEMLGNCLKKKRSERLSSAEELVSALDEIGSDRRHAVRRSHSHGQIPASHSDFSDNAVAAAVFKAQATLSWLVRQVVPLAHQKRNSVLKATLPWISLLVVGWAFLWIVAEIARETLNPNPVDVDARRIITPRSAPPRQEESESADVSPLGGISLP